LVKHIKSLFASTHIFIGTYYFTCRLSRVCAEDCTINGIKFKQGLVVRLMTSPMYSDASIFPNPEKFDPERYVVVCFTSVC